MSTDEFQNTPLPDESRGRIRGSGRIRPSLGVYQAEQYASDMVRVKAALEAGLDPTVKLPFVATHTQRSPATLYRDIASGHLPKPTKVGRSSSWRFSDVEAYRAGASSVKELT